MSGRLTMCASRDCPLAAHRGLRRAGAIREPVCRWFMPSRAARPAGVDGGGRPGHDGMAGGA